MLETFDLVRGPIALAYCIGGALCELATPSEVADVIGQMLDLVRPGGCVVLEVPNFDHLRAQAARLEREVNSAPDDVRYGDLEDAEHPAGSPARGSISADELRLYVPPVTGYREDGSELRLEQQYVWDSEMRELTLRWQFDAPEESSAGELSLLELPRDVLAGAVPENADVKWHGDWDGSDWSVSAAHTIAVLRPK
jgi:SAM-dependent methyltransferase